MAGSSVLKSVGILGGGVIGLSCAYYLEKKGFQVSVLDPGDFKDGCSYINAGMIVPSHVIPLAAPGMVAKGLRRMLHPGSPFALHLRPDGDLLRWAWQFYRAATRQNVDRAIPILRDISWLSKSLYQELARQPGFSFGLTEKGLLMLYRTREGEREEAATARLANMAGVRAEILSPREVQALEPELEVSVRGGVYFPGDASLDPRAFMECIKADLQAKGMALLSGTTVTGFEKKLDTLSRVITDRGDYCYDEVVIACGSWSGSLLKELGTLLLLQGGKGYSFQLENCAKNIHTPSILVDGKVAISPARNSLRVSGTLEIGGDPLLINKRRVLGITRTLHQFYPGLRATAPVPENTVSGLRPCSPDGLPYIGRIPSLRNVTLATGHGMLGMSLGPGTGWLVSELLAGNKPGEGFAGFDPGRFD